MTQYSIHICANFSSASEYIRRQIFFAVFTKVHNCGTTCKDIFKIKVVNHLRSLLSEQLSLALCSTCLLKYGCVCSLLIIVCSVRHVKMRLSMM